MLPDRDICANQAGYLNTFSDEYQKMFKTAQAAGCPPFTLLAICDPAWNQDMASRDSLPAFKNTEPRTSSADDYLHHLAEEIIPVAEAEIHRAPQWCGIAGYSLAGLFALYAI